jgi:hypothetical protein
MVRKSRTDKNDTSPYNTSVSLSEISIDIHPGASGNGHPSKESLFELKLPHACSRLARVVRELESLWQET